METYPDNIRLYRQRRATVDMTPEESRFFGYICVVSGMLSHAAIGIVQLWGNINVYVTSYLRVYDKTITMENTYPVFAISVSISAVFM